MEKRLDSATKQFLSAPQESGELWDMFSPPLRLFLFGAGLLTDNVTLPTQPLSQAGITSFISCGLHFSFLANCNTLSMMLLPGPFFSSAPSGSVS